MEPRHGLHGYLRWGLIALALQLYAGPAVAQFDTMQVDFRPITIRDGLSQGMVNSIVQDQAGFLWFATKDGLNRYDGYDFTVFRHNPADSTTLRDNLVTDLLYDRAGRLWVATSTGLDLFEPATETFRHLPCPGQDDRPRQPLLGCPIIGLAEDLDGRIWVSSYERLGVIDRDTTDHGAGKNLTIRVRMPIGVQGLHVDDHGQLQGWTARHNTYLRIDTRRAGSPVDSLTPPMLPATFQLQGRTPATASSYDMSWYSRTQRRDGDGATWSVMVGMLFRHDPVKGRLWRMLASNPMQQVMLDNVSCVFFDRHGLLWVGTRGYGLLTYDPRHERFNHVPDESVRWLSPITNGRVLVITDRITLFDPRTGSNPPALLNRGRTGQPTATWPSETNMVQDPFGTFWFGPHGLSRTTGTVERNGTLVASGLEQLDTEPIYRFRVIGDSICYCRKPRHALVCRSLITGHSTEYPLPVADGPNFYHFVQDFLRDQQGTYWLGTMGGLMSWAPGAGGWTLHSAPAGTSGPVPEIAVFSLLEDPTDPANILWVGTNGGGLLRFDKRTGNAKRYGSAEGLPNEVIYGLLAADDGRIWMSTNKGLARLDPQTGEVRTYDATDGLQSDEFNRDAYCKLPDGTLFFGGVNGFNYFKPEALEDDLQPVRVAITGIKLTNQPVAFGVPGSPLQVPASQADGIEVPYAKANMLTLEFAGMAFGDPGGLKYRYMLEGFDGEPIDAGATRSAIYTNLGPGAYTFKVWARNRDGIWNASPTTFQVHILPPWYMTGWARILFALLLIGAGVLFIHVRTRSLRRQRSLLEHTVLQRTTDLRHAKERAEQSERIKQQFLANMSHEIRTPVHAILGMNNALRRREHLPGQEPYLDAIARSSGNLLELVNEILDLSKIEAGHLALEKVPLDPREVLTAVVEVMRHRAEEKKLELSTHVSRDVPRTVIGDPGRLNQVLMNLVGNAIKFTTQGGIRVALDAKELPSGTVMLHGSVIDTGIGIAADRLSQIFDEFTQADNSHTRKFGGSGLGLTITKRLVEMQGGTLEVESTPGQGSIFTFIIPYAPATQDPAPAEVNTLVADEHRGLSGLRVLLVEDHALNVMVAKDELTDAIPNVEIEVAIDGQEAVDMVTRGTYDLILMDVQMPVMDGYEATRVIRSLEKDREHVPIIGVTANVMRTELEKCLEAGMDGYLTKPFSREELLAAMERALGK